MLIGMGLLYGFSSSVSRTLVSGGEGGDMLNHVSASHKPNHCQTETCLI